MIFFLVQGKCAVEILKKFEILDRKAITTPMASNLKLLCDASLETVDATMYRQMICSLMCLTNTRPDICFVVNTLSQFLTDPRNAHLVVKHVVRYLKGTVDYRLKYDTNQKANLHGYVDLDWAGNATNRNITSGCCFSLGSSMISWFSRKQSCVALSTTEEDYIVACLTSCKEVWIRKLFYDLFNL